MATDATAAAPDDSAAARLRRRRNFFGVLAIVLGLVALLPAGDLASRHSNDEAFRVGPSPHLVVAAPFSGRLTVHGGDAGAIQVRTRQHGPWRGDAQVRQSGDTVEIRASSDGWHGFLTPATRSQVDATVPPGTQLDVQGVAGEVAVEGVEGSATIHALTGAVTLESVSGTFDVRALNGAIDVRDFTGTARLHALNGAVVVERARGVFDVRTANGAVRLDARLDPGGQNRIETLNGRVDVKLADPSVRIDAAARHGGVESTLLVEAEPSGANTLTGTVGGGAAGLVVRTMNGRIRIE